MELAILRLEECVNKSLHKLIVGANVNKAKEEESNEYVKRRRLEAKINEWRKRLLHGQHFREIEGTKSIDT